MCCLYRSSIGRGGWRATGWSSHGISNKSIEKKIYNEARRREYSISTTQMKEYRINSVLDISNNQFLANLGWKGLWSRVNYSHVTDIFV